MSNNFEEVANTSAPLPEVTTEAMHSGSHSYKMNPSAEFGAGWDAPWETIGDPRKIQVRAWVNLPHGRLKAAIVVQVKRGGQPYYLRYIMLHQVVKRYQQWEPVHKIFVLPRNIEPSDQVCVFIWHFDQRHPWYVDDIVVERVD
jgi:hypothetical protein